ncbi:hypothetical protein BGZ92_007474 [Podila epicladia]|nr:hypothetical protein BGZ92_007474 [Podila epicladia]
MAERLQKRGFQIHIPVTPAGETKLMVQRGRTQVKIEVNCVMRGTVQPVRHASLTPIARDLLLADLVIPVVSLEDVYGGKLVAALDRQHPRDLFDVMQLFAHEGITPGIRRAFIVYLISHNRPIHEVLFASPRDIQYDYEHSFVGMTVEPVSLNTLLAARERLMHELQHGLDDNERQFLLSMLVGEPEWSRLGIAHLEHMPGVRWKLHNLAQLKKVNMKKFTKQASALAARLATL